MTMQHRIVLALGSNLGDSAATLDQAVTELAEFISCIRRSLNYVTEPVGDPEQPKYLNAVVVGVTKLRPEELLTRLQGIESLHGRLRTEHWGARTLDIDLIDFDSAQSHSETLTLPHPRAHQRAFVLIPWHEIDPQAVLIGHGPVASIIDSLDASGVVRL
jgi:2-amino-4-hydroxy-6-hydroxymethyldihydropteridine diphosphokinase